VPRVCRGLIPISRLAGAQRNNMIRMITEAAARGWENFTARPEGPLNFRFIIQPTLASIIAIRAGLKDAKAGKPAYLWTALTSSVDRAALLHGGWKDMRVPFLVAAVLDAIYQIIIHRWIYPLELLFTATLLALVPYVILRGPVNRVSRRFLRNDGAARVGNSSLPPAEQ